jgi:hypothetical protein
MTGPTRICPTTLLADSEKTGAYRIDWGPSSIVGPPVSHLTKPGGPASMTALTLTGGFRAKKAVRTAAWYYEANRALVRGYCHDSE